MKILERLLFDVIKDPVLFLGNRSAHRKGAGASRDRQGRFFRIHSLRPFDSGGGGQAQCRSLERRFVPCAMAVNPRSARRRAAVHSEAASGSLQNPSDMVADYLGWYLKSSRAIFFLGRGGDVRYATPVKRDNRQQGEACISSPRVYCGIGRGHWVLDLAG